jgi:hypothetical protein
VYCKLVKILLLGAFRDTSPSFTDLFTQYIPVSGLLRNFFDTIEIGLGDEEDINTYLDNNVGLFEMPLSHTNNGKPVHPIFLLQACIEKMNIGHISLGEMVNGGHEMTLAESMTAKVLAEYYFIILSACCGSFLTGLAGKLCYCC